MKKNALVLVIFICTIQLSFGQGSKISSIKQQATDAFSRGNYELTVSKVNELTSVFKEVPPLYLSLRIRALSAMITKNPFEEYQRIESTRRFIAAYLNNSSAKKNDGNYNSIVNISAVFESYPKNENLFNDAKKQQEFNEIAKKKQEAAEAELLRKKVLRDNIVRDSLKVVNTARAKVQFTKDSLQAIRQSEINRVLAQKAAVQAEINRKKQAIIDKRNIRVYNFKTHTFSNFGVITGEIAKYGILFEHGGGRYFLGYHASVRSSLTKETDIFNGNDTQNKTEFDVGPNIKLSNYFYLNLGAGYGFYNYANRNDYLNSSPTLEMQTYLVTTGGLMVRLGRLINLSGGVSFMDIDKGFYRPEIIAGLTFNLKSN